MSEQLRIANSYSIRLIAVTPDAEKLIGYCARVSSPQNQDNEDVAKLLGYCIRNKHFSIFEMANMVVEIKTTRAISAQILRHRSFTFQEFSQRYASANEAVVYPARRQDQKNRQNSIDDLSTEAKDWFERVQRLQWDQAKTYYDHATGILGIAKECARFLLPMNTATTIYMNGTLRSWIHYLELRTAHGTQQEHKDIAEEIKKIFSESFPQIARGLGWGQ